MKKRGVDPNSRTYTIMLNAYAGTPHSGDVEPTFTPNKTLSNKQMTRIVSTYNSSQTYVAGCIRRVREAQAQGDKEDLAVLGDADMGGEAYRSMSDRQRALRDDKEQISVAPTNAYLKLLTRYGLWDQVDAVHLAMDRDGPLSPNSRTYSILFSALLNRYAQQNEKRYAGVRDEITRPMSVEEFGSRARSLFESAVKQFHPIEKPKGYQWDKQKRIDEDLALLVLRALFQARPEDQRLALSLVPFLWKLPEPLVGLPLNTQQNTNLRPTAGIPASMMEIPLIRPTPKSAMMIILLASRANKTSHAVTWARALFAIDDLKKHGDFGFFRAVMHCLADEGDVEGVKEILDSYQPPTGSAGWHIYIWENALIAARKSADFPFAMSVIRRMAHLPYGVEDGLPPSQQKEYKWKAPGGKKVDIQGHAYVKADAIAPSPKCISLLFKTAFAASSSTELDKQTRQAYNVFSHFPLHELFTIPDWDYKRGKTIRLIEDDPAILQGDFHPSLYNAADWRLELAKDVKKASELMMERAERSEKEALGEVYEIVTGILEKWGTVLDPNAAKKPIGRAIGLRLMHGAAPSAPASMSSGSGSSSYAFSSTAQSAQSALPVQRAAQTLKVGRRSASEEEITDISQLQANFDEFEAAYGEDEEMEDYEPVRERRGGRTKPMRRISAR